MMALNVSISLLILSITMFVCLTLPNIDQFKVIDQEKSQIAHETKEAIHIRKADPELNRNVGKMVIPCVFDPIGGIKPKNPCISLLLSQESGSQEVRSSSLTPRENKLR